MMLRAGGKVRRSRLLHFRDDLPARDTLVYRRAEPGSHWPSTEIGTLC